jgi:excisionase family DNA binding protein
MGVEAGNGGGPSARPLRESDGNVSDGLMLMAPLRVRIPRAIQLIGIGRSKLYELIQQGQIETIKIGSVTLIPLASIKGLLDKNRK